MEPLITFLDPLIFDTTCDRSSLNLIRRSQTQIHVGILRAGKPSGFRHGIPAPLYTGICMHASRCEHSRPLSSPARPVELCLQLCIGPARPPARHVSCHSRHSSAEKSGAP